MRGASAIVTFAGPDAVDGQSEGVARCSEDVRLRAGRILARPATGSETAHLQMDRCWETHDGRPLRRRLAKVLCPGSSPWAKGSKRVEDPGDTSKPNTACGTSSLLDHSESPDAYLAEYRIGIRHQGCIGHPAFRTPSSGRVRWECAKLGRASAARMRSHEFRK